MLLVNYRNGKKQHGMLLALGNQSIRVAIEGAADSVIFRLVNGFWVSEDCEVVTFDFAETGFPVHEETDFRDTVFPKHHDAPAVERVM